MLIVENLRKREKYKGNVKATLQNLELAIVIAVLEFWRDFFYECVCFIHTYIYI
jgi:hypothetical protein